MPIAGWERIATRGAGALGERFDGGPLRECGGGTVLWSGEDRMAEGVGRRGAGVVGVGVEGR